MKWFGKKKDEEKKEEKKTVNSIQNTESKEEKKAEASDKAPQESIQISLPEELVQPRVSEKAGQLAKLNKYAFVVKRNANKVEVKKAVERAHKVTVTDVNIINVKAKTKRVGRILGKTSKFKKAVVTLKQGDRIEGVTETV